MFTKFQSLSFGFAIILMVNGCQQESVPTSQRQPEGTPPVSQQTAAVGDAASAQLPQGVRVDEEGKQWIDDIPYDIWFDEPLSKVEAADLTLTSPATITPASQPAAASEKSTKSTATSTATQAPAAGGWGKLISTKALENEVTAISNKLGTALRQLGTFNKSLDEVHEQSVTLTAVSLVASQHSGDFRWKKQALVLADCGTRIQEHSQTKGRAAFKANQIPLEQVRSILNGETVSLDTELNSDTTFSQRVPRGPLMYRMERAYDWLDENIDSAGSLKQKKEEAEHEAAILAMLGKIISAKGYPSTEEEGYMKEANGYTTASVALSETIENTDYETFRTVLDRIENHCSNCHADWRFAE